MNAQWSNFAIDDDALISVFYVLGYLHGMRYGASKVSGEAYTDRESEKWLTEALLFELSAIGFGTDTEPAVEPQSPPVS